MKTLAKNSLLIVLLLILMAIGVAFYAIKNRERKAREIKQIHDILDSNTGIDGTDIKMLISGTAVASGFDATALAKQIKDAHKGWWWDDDEDAVYAAFAGKTKAQVAAIYAAFTNLYGLDLDTYLKSFLDIETEYSNVLRIIKQAA